MTLCAGLSRLDGVIPILKPPGMTSHDVVSLIRRVLGIKKAGHAGTLDPEAAGVLPILIGRATKIMPYLEHLEKAYRAEIVFGIATDTMDASGSVTSEKRGFRIPREVLMKALERFEGKIKQVPPMVSAVHHRGKRLYELARQGVVVERPAREVEIFRIEVFNWGHTGMEIGFGDSVTIDVRCSQGTYIRALCHDIGEMLGCGAYLLFLLRTESSGFSIGESVTLEELSRAVSSRRTHSIVVPISYALRNMPSVAISPEEVSTVAAGGPISRAYLPGDIRNLPDGTKLRLMYDGAVVAIAIASNSGGQYILKPERVLLPAMRSNQEV